MGINDMEFHWRWKWSYRPVQRDGTTVAEYYDCFCAWKERMVNFSCPADEGDYIDGFIDNLVWEIRLRIGPKSRSRMSRLSNAFYAAKFEESMMFMEEAFKKIEAHILFDKMPSRIPADKFQVDVSKDSACKVFDKMAESIPTESSSFDQVLGNVNCNSAMTDKDSIPEVIDVDPLLKSEEKSCYDDIVQINDDVAVQIEAGSGKIVFPNADHKVFDELSKPTFPATTPYKLIDEELDVDSGLNYQAEATPKQGFRNSENVALKMFDKSTGVVFTGLKSFPGKFNSISTIEEVEFSSLKAGIQLVEEVEELFPLKQKDVKIANQLFDEMPKSFSMKTECLSTGRSLFDEMSYLSPVKRHDKIKGREEVVLQVINTSKFIFDPGGSTLHHMGCVAFESNKYSVFPIVCMTDYEDFVTELNSYVENGLRTNDSEIKMTIEGPHTQKIAIKCCFTIDENKRKMAGKRMETLLQITLSSCLKFMFDPGGQFEMRYPLTKTLEKRQRLKIRHRRFFLSTTNTTTDISTWHNQIVGDLEGIHCSKPMFGSGGGKSSSWHLVGVSQIFVAASRKRKMDHSVRADLMLPIALLVKEWRGRTAATVASGYEPIVTLFDLEHKDNMLFPEFIKLFKAKLYWKILEIACGQTTRILDEMVALQKWMMVGLVEIGSKVLWSSIEMDVSRSKFNVLEYIAMDEDIDYWILYASGLQPFNGCIYLLFMGNELVSSLSLDEGVLGIQLANFVWDPGLCDIFFLFFFVYILEDKDVFEREGKRMICIGDNGIQWDMIMRYIGDNET